MEWIIVLIVSAVLIAFIMNAMRRAALMKKYGDKALVDRLMRRMIWEGQTAGQLVDAIGKPAQIDEKVMKAKTRDTWKYNQRSRTRFGLRVTVEDGVVVGWDKKA